MYPCRARCRRDRVGSSAESAVAPMNYMADECDRRASLHGLRFGRHMTMQPGLAQEMDVQSRQAQPVQTDDQWLDWSKSHLGSDHHAACTGRTGSAGDAMSMVTQDLELRGEEGLQMHNASVTLHRVAGDTNAGAIVAGNKAAGLVMGRTASARVHA